MAAAAACPAVEIVPAIQRSGGKTGAPTSVVIAS